MSLVYLYGSGIFWALIVFAVTYFHRQIGLIILMLVVAACFIELGNPRGAAGENYSMHWDFSCRLTFVLSILLFFAAILLKRRLKRKRKVS